MAIVDEIIPMFDIEETQQTDIKIDVEQEQIVILQEETVIRTETQSKTPKSLQDRIQKALDENTLFPADDIK